jgi:dTDP-4-dehydrorhamnose reductase
LNVYGKSKLAGERAVQETNPESLIFRLSWVTGKGKQNFLYKLSQWAAKNQVLKISADETSVPTFTDDIVNTTLMGLEKNIVGMFHLVNSDYASRYELARYFVKKAGLNNIVVPVPLSYFNNIAERPVFTAMSNRKISGALDIVLPDWREGVDRYALYFAALGAAK